MPPGTLDCSRCRARLSMPTLGSVVRCPHCGTDNFVSAMASPRAAPGRVRWVWVIAGLVAVAALAGGGFLLARRGATATLTPRPGPPPTPRPPPAAISLPRPNPATTSTTPRLPDGTPVQLDPPKRIAVLSERPHAVDVNGDGIDDIVALTEDVKNGDLSLRAFSGKDLSVLWQSEPLSGGSGADAPRVFVTRRDVLFSRGTDLRAYSLDRGVRQWRTQLSDLPVELSGKGRKLRVTTRDEQTVSVNSKTGKATRTGRAKRAKFAWTSDEALSLAPRPSKLVDLRGDPFPGLQVERGFCERSRTSNEGPGGATEPPGSDFDHCHAKMALAYATRAKGSRIPFLIGFRVGRSKPRWREQLTPKGSVAELGVGFDQLRAEIVGDRALVFFRVAGSAAPTLALVELENGRRAFTTELTLGPLDQLKGLALGRRRVLVKAGTRVLVLDAGTGESVGML